MAEISDERLVDLIVGLVSGKLVGLSHRRETGDDLASRAPLCAASRAPAAARAPPAAIGLLSAEVRRRAGCGAPTPPRLPLACWHTGGEALVTPEAAAWFGERTSRAQDWTIARLRRLKAAGGGRVSVVIPARDEESTIGNVVRRLRGALMGAEPLVDELVVMDSDSRDATARVAAEAGARVHAAGAVRPDLGRHPGKGEAIWKSLFVTTGDLLVFVDADLTMFGPHFVTGLLGPLLAEPSVQLVKGFYDRILDIGDQPSTEGGRVTELVARPLLNVWWPDLAAVVQPLAGEWAARRTLMESLAIPVGYGVELASLLDTHAGAGLGAIAQVDLGARAHRHQAVHDLAVMAAELLTVAETRRGRQRPAGPPAATLSQFVRDGGRASWRSRSIPLAERPPVASVRAGITVTAADR